MHIFPAVSTDMVSQCYAKLGDGMVDGDQCHAKLRDRLYSLGKWKWYHSVMQNWDHLHKSQGKWYHSVTETMGPFYIKDCEKDITVLWRMLGPFTRWHHNVLQTLGPFTWREGEWYHSVMQNLQITYTTARGNGITVWCKTLGPFTQHPEEMVTVLHKLEDHLRNALGKWYYFLRQNFGTKTLTYTTP